MPDVLDVRWHWLEDALHRLYRELEPGDQLALILIGVVGADGQQREYVAATGTTEIARLILTGDREAVLSVFQENITDATVWGEGNGRRASP